MRNIQLTPKNRIVALIVVILLGIVFRLYLSTLAYPTLVFDTQTYVEFAQEFLRGHTPIDCCTKSMGYPLFLAEIFWLRGAVDIQTVKFIQVLLDVATGLLVWIAAKKVFSQKIGDIALFFYLVNPFTSSFVGLLLPEALSTFLVALILVIVTTESFKSRPISWLLFGMTIGVLLFVRLSFLYVALGLFVALVVFSFTKTLRFKFFAVAMLGFLLISSYSIIGNYRMYKKISIIPPYTMAGGQLYLTFFMERYPEVEFWGIDQEVTRVFNEYQITPIDQKDQFNKHYMALFFEKLQREPFVFVWHYLKNMFWIWDKDHLFVYTDPWYPADRYTLRVANLMLLAIGGMGVLRYMKKDYHWLGKPFVLFTLFLAGVMTFMFPLVSSESRHTLLFYPTLLFWAAYALGRFIPYETK